MISKDAPIINKLGLHARAAAKLVALAASFECDVFISKDGKEVNGKSIMGIMMLAASKGSIITITTNGVDEPDAMLAIEQLLADRFGEED